MTKYRSGWHINSIPDPESDDPDLPKRKASYKSIYVSINWISISTHSDAANIFPSLPPTKGHQITVAMKHPCIPSYT